MRKIYHIMIVLAAAGVSLNAAAQNGNGGIRISGVTLTQNGNRAHLEMAVDIQGDAVTKYQSMTLVPSLIGGNNRAPFPSILVSGKNKTQMDTRKNKLRKSSAGRAKPMKVVPIDKKNRGEKISYSADIDYETWMEEATVEVEFLLSSFAGEFQVYAVEVNAAQVIRGPQETVATVVQPQPESVAEKPAATQNLTGTAYLDFVEESYTVMPDFKRNPEELAKFEEHVNRIKRNPNAEITKVTIIGYASPEGRYSKNDILAFERSRSFAKYIQSKYGISLVDSMVGSVAEDWGTLRQMIVDGYVPSKSAVLAIIDDVSLAPDAKESKLRRLDNGRVWRILIDQMFPQLRRVEYTIEYTVK